MAHVRKLKNQEGSKIYVKVRLLRILFQRCFQKSTILLAPTAELNSCKNSSQWRYCKNLCKSLDPTLILVQKLIFEGWLVRDLSLVFLYLIYVELHVRGRSPVFFLGKGKKSINLESVVSWLYNFPHIIAIVHTDPYVDLSLLS